MNQNTVNKLKIGDVVVITNKDSKNYGKQGIVSEIARMTSGKAWRIYLKPLNCKFEFEHYSVNLCNKEGLHGWSPSFLSMPKKRKPKSDRIFYILPMFGADGIEWPTENFTETELRIINRFLDELGDRISGVRVDSIAILDNEEEE